MGSDRDLDRVLWRLAHANQTGIPPQLTGEQLQVLVDRVTAVTATVPVRLGSQEAWSSRRSGRAELLPDEVLGLCLDALEHRFPPNLSRKWAGHLIEELRAGGVDVRAFDHARIRSAHRRPSPG